MKILCRKTVGLLLLAILLMVSSQVLAEKEIVVYDPFYAIPSDAAGYEDVWKILDDPGKARSVYSQALFHELHPDVEIVREGINMWSAEAVMTALTSGSKVAFYPALYFNGLNAGVRDQAFADITELLKESGLLDKMPESLKEDLRVGDRYYGLPWWGEVNTHPLAYRKDLFKDAGLSFPSEDWTWEDLARAAKKLTKDTDGDGRPDVWGLSVAGAGGAGGWLSQIAYDFGAPPELLRPDPTGKFTWRSAVNTEPVIKALEFIQHMARDKSILTGPEVGYSALFENFKGGRAAMVFQIMAGHHILYQGGYANLFGPGPDEKYVGLAVPPKGPEGIQSDTRFVSVWGFNPRLSEEELKAAFDWIVWNQFGLGRALNQHMQWMLGENPYIAKLSQVEPESLGWPPKEEYIPAEYIEAVNKGIAVPRPPQHAEYGIANSKSFMAELSSLVQGALFDPNFDAKAEAEKTAAYIDRSILNYKLDGVGVDDVKAYFLDLRDFYKEHFPEFFNGTFQELWDKYYEVW